MAEKSPTNPRTFVSTNPKVLPSPIGVADARRVLAALRAAQGHRFLVDDVSLVDDDVPIEHERAPLFVYLVINKHLRGLRNGVNDLPEPVHRVRIPESDIGREKAREDDRHNRSKPTVLTLRKLPNDLNPAHGAML